MSTVKTKMETDVEALIRKHQAQVWQYLRYLGANPAEADDLTQETFLSLMRSSYEDRGEAAFLGFLRKIARNQLLMFRRKSAPSWIPFSLKLPSTFGRERSKAMASIRF